MIEVTSRNGSRIALDYPGAFKLMERLYYCCQRGHGVAADANQGIPEIMLCDDKKRPLMPGFRPALDDAEMLERFKQVQHALKGQMPLPFSGLHGDVEWTDESQANPLEDLRSQMERDRIAATGKSPDLVEAAEKAGIPVSAATKAAIAQATPPTPPREPRDAPEDDDGGFGQDDDAEYQAELAALRAKQAKRAADKLAKLEAEQTAREPKPPNHGHEPADDGFAIPKSEIGAMDGREWFLTAHPARKDMVIAYRKGSPAAIAAGDQPAKQQVEPKTKKNKKDDTEASYEPKPSDPPWMHWAHAAGHAIPAGNHAHAKAERARLEKKYAELTAPKVDPKAPADDDGDFGDE